MLHQDESQKKKPQYGSPHFALLPCFSSKTDPPFPSVLKKLNPPLWWRGWGLNYAYNSTCMYPCTHKGNQGKDRLYVWGMVDCAKKFWYWYHCLDLIYRHKNNLFLFFISNLHWWQQPIAIIIHKNPLYRTESILIVVLIVNIKQFHKDIIFKMADWMKT